MTSEEIKHIFNEESSRVSGATSNSDAIAMTYYEYHGKYDDGDSLVDTIDQALSKGVRLA